ncbi:hypothetical protein NBRC116187_22280 [Halopseudomonas sabulinigri]|uniref:Uncharacterized protein n=1 Tax=Halopseudomonas sabulinigri TaxID=472181 RepID=A0ABP9ZR09_9GAMM
MVFLVEVAQPGAQLMRHARCRIRQQMQLFSAMRGRLAIGFCGGWHIDGRRQEGSSVAERARTCGREKVQRGRSRPAAARGTVCGCDLLADFRSGDQLGFYLLPGEREAVPLFV